MKFGYDDRSPAQIAYDNREPVGRIDAAMNEELGSLPEEHQQRAAMALRPQGGPMGSWAETCATAAREAEERDRAHEERQAALTEKIDGCKESDPARSKLYGMQKDGEQKAYEAKVWQSIASKEFAMRGDTDSYQDYRRDSGEANRERAEIQERFNEAREAYQKPGTDQTKTESSAREAQAEDKPGQDQRPGFQRRNENSRLDKPDPDKPNPPAAALAVPKADKPDAIAPEDREKWLRDQGASNATFIKNATRDDQTFEKVRGMMEAQASQQPREPSRETVERLDSRAQQQAEKADKKSEVAGESEAEEPDQTQTEEARNRPRRR